MNEKLLRASQWITKHVPLVLAGGAVSTALILYPFIREHDIRKADSRVKQLAEQNTKLRAETEEFKKKYEEIELDRNNILEKTRTLLEEKGKWTEAADELDALRKTNSVITGQKDKLLAEM